MTGGGADLTLTPTFVSGTETYTAMVVQAVDEVTVTAETTDSGATIDYLDSSDTMLDDVDTSTAGHQVTLAEGDNVIKVKVTAADGTTELDLHGDGEPAGGHGLDLRAEHRRPVVRRGHGGRRSINELGVTTIGYGFVDTTVRPVRHRCSRVGTNPDPYTIECHAWTGSGTPSPASCFLASS